MNFKAHKGWVSAVRFVDGGGGGGEGMGGCRLLSSANDSVVKLWDTSKQYRGLPRCVRRGGGRREVWVEFTVASSTTKKPDCFLCVCVCFCAGLSLGLIDMLFICEQNKTDRGFGHDRSPPQEEEEEEEVVPVKDILWLYLLHGVS